MAYNYHEAVKNETRVHIETYISVNDIALTNEKRNDVFDYVLQKYNPSRTWISKLLAEMSLKDNISLLNEVVNENNIDEREVARHFLSEEWIWFDLLIRRYLVRKHFDEIFSEYLN